MIFTVIILIVAAVFELKQYFIEKKYKEIMIYVAFSVIAILACALHDPSKNSIVYNIMNY